MTTATNDTCDFRIFFDGEADAAAALQRARDAGYNLFDAGGGVLQASCDETTTPEQLRGVASALAGAAVIGSDRRILFFLRCGQELLLIFGESLRLPELHDRRDLFFRDKRSMQAMHPRRSRRQI